METHVKVEESEPALSALARHIHETAGHLCLGAECSWDELDEGDKHAYLALAERTIMEKELIAKAADELSRPVMKSR